MSIKSAVQKTIAYTKRNGVRAAFFAALERLSYTVRTKYNYVSVSEAVLKEQRQEYKLLAEAEVLPRFSVVVPLFNTPEKYLRQMIDSVVAQTYGNWELVLADATPTPLSAISEYAKADPRIRYLHLEKNAGISENTNRAIEVAAGDYIGLLDHDDVLTPDALYEMFRVIRSSMKKNRLAKYSLCPLRLIYSDEDKLDDKSGRFVEPHLKTDFNMDLLFSNNYICHFTMLRADIIKRLKLRKEYDGAQDYDLFLRACAEAALLMPQASVQIAHIDKVLYHWRIHSSSTAANPSSKNYAYEAGARALQNLCDSYSLGGEVSELSHVGFYHVSYGDDVFKRRPDLGCIGGRVIDKNHRICGGMYDGNGTLMFNGLREEYSGGLQHRAVLQQDTFAVDVRCVVVRPELASVFEEITGMKAEVSMSEAADKAGAMESENSAEKVVLMSRKFGEEVRRRGLRVMWDPLMVLRLKQ